MRSLNIAECEQISGGIDTRSVPEALEVLGTVAGSALGVMLFPKNYIIPGVLFGVIGGVTTRFIIQSFNNQSSN